MATLNPFDLLGNDDTEDPSLLAASAPVKKTTALPQAGSAQSQPAKPAKLPTKPLPPAQAVRESKEGFGRGGGRGGGRGYGRGRGFNRDSANNNDNFGNSQGFSGGYRPSENGDGGKPFERRDSDAPRGSFHGGRRGGFSNGEVADGDERPRRVFDRRSGTGRGNEFKRDGSGRGNWGDPTDEIAPASEEPVTETEKDVSTEKPTVEDGAVDANKPETEENEPEDKEMTLEEYEKLLEEKRKPLLAMKTEERKAIVDNELGSMMQLSNKKQNDEYFVKLGFEKDKRKDAADKEEKAKKSVSINEFLKPAEGERYRGPGGRGRGRGRGSRGGGGGGAGGGYSVGGGYSGGSGYGGGGYASNVAAPSIEDPGQFPTLGGK